MTTKRPRPKTETKPTAGTRKARQTAATMPEPPAILLTRDNTRDVLREHYEAKAARWLQMPWDGLTEDAEQAAIRQWKKERDGREALLRACMQGNEPPPYDAILKAMFCVWDYPAHLGGIGLRDPKMRLSTVVQSAIAEIEAQFNYAGRVLYWTARTLDTATAVAVHTGLKALRATFEPNPDGYGTATGIAYPRKEWPDDMNTNAAAWARLPEPLRADLRALRDALARLNAGAGGKAERGGNDESKTVEQELKRLAAYVKPPAERTVDDAFRLAIKNAPGKNITEKRRYVARLAMELIEKKESIPFLNRRMENELRVRLCAPGADREALIVNYADNGLRARLKRLENTKA